jgi:hypothetical protein
MLRRSAVRSWTIPGLALGGVLLGHAATYALLHPAAGTREDALRAAGHAYLGTAARLALPLTVVALATLLLGQAIHANRGAERFRDLALRLVCFQTGVFAAMELLERLGSGSGTHDLGPALAVGLPLQAAVALAIAWLLRRLLGGVDHACSSLASPAGLSRRPSRALKLALSATIPGRASVDAVAIRAPPAAR